MEFVIGIRQRASFLECANESESNKFVSYSFSEISKFMALEVPEDYNFSLGMQEGVMDLFDFV